MVFDNFEFEKIAEMQSRQGDYVYGVKWLKPLKVRD
jgi:hypothetical protein